jgi:hypothetical protein
MGTELSVSRGRRFRLAVQMYQLRCVRILKMNSAQNGNTVVFNLRLDRAVCEVFREALSTNLRAVLLHAEVAREEAPHML